MLTGVCWWENSRLEEVQHSHLKLKYSPVLRSTLLGKGMCWICVIKWGDHTSSVFPYRSYFHVVIAKCTPWHTLPALLLNLEHGKGRWFPLTGWEDQLTGRITEWCPVWFLWWFLLPAVGTKGTWQGSASGLRWLPTGNFSLDRLFQCLVLDWCPALLLNVPPGSRVSRTVKELISHEEMHTWERI